MRVSFDFICEHGELEPWFHCRECQMLPLDVRPEPPMGSLAKPRRSSSQSSAVNREGAQSWLHAWSSGAQGTPEGHRIRHIAGNLFSSRGVSVGDQIYVITRSGCEILLVCVAVVDRYVSESEAKTLLGYEVYPAPDHLLLSSATPARFDRKIPTDMLRDLRFQRKDGVISSVTFDRHGCPDKQTFRTLRNLTPDSARELDRLA